MVCNVTPHDNIAHFRIDRMKNVELIDSPVRNFEEVSEYRGTFNIADYSNKYFSMFSGDVEKIRVKFANKRIDQVLDKIGLQLRILKVEDGFEVMFNSSVDDGLASWILTFGNDAEVIYPGKLKDMVISKAKDILSNYGIENIK